jgi:hypothetical protein
LLHIEELNVLRSLLPGRRARTATELG